MNTMKKTLICSLLLILSLTSPSLAEVGRKTPSLDGTTSAGPYYNPSTKSYFELFVMQKASGIKYNWAHAKELAENRFFKNTRGRLATVKDLATHQFILRNFSAKNYWIGLQYFCGTRSLKWVDGSDGSQTNFSAWDVQWSNTHIRCGNKGYMPVHYTTATPTKALRWRASGPEKFYLNYLVEYPTGKE